MKKRVKIGIGVMAVLALCVVGLFLYKQYSHAQHMANYIPPQHETQSSILDYVQQNDIPGEIAIAKDTAGYNQLFPEFGPGTIIVLDGNMDIVDLNIASGGMCYADIGECITKGFDFSTSEYNGFINSSEYLNRLKESTVFLTDFDWNQLDQYDHVVIYSWAKWMKISHTNGGIVQKIGNWVEENESSNTLILSINTDAVTPWYPQEAELPLLGV